MAEEFVNRLLSDEARETPSDTKKIEELTVDLPEYFDETKFNQARRFYWYNCYGFTMAMLLGLVSVLAVPSILKIMIGARRSNDVYPAFKRYLSTFLHSVSWFEEDLKPGSFSWQSVHAVRKLHIRMGRAAKLKGQGIISQRDLALTQFGFVGFTFLKHAKFGIKTLQNDDWEAYNQFWKVIGYMIGIENKYNICRENIEETRQVCQHILQRVFTPCMTSVPEYFEYMARIMLEGVSSTNPTVDTTSLLYWTKYLADVPGYVYTEAERIQLQKLLQEKLNGGSYDKGVEASALFSKPAVEELPENKTLLYIRDYDSFGTIPEYNQLSITSKCMLAFNSFFTSIYSTYIGRKVLNGLFLLSLKVMKYYPRIAFLQFNIKIYLANYLLNFPIDNGGLKPNSTFYKKPSKTSWLYLIPSIFSTKWLKCPNNMINN